MACSEAPQASSGTAAAPDADNSGDEGGPIDFTPGGVPRRYPDLVQLYSVLMPLTGTLGDDDQVVASTKKLEGRWRGRVMALAEAGWPGLCGNDPKPWRNRRYALNCRPSFIITPERTRCCRHRQVCPFCWARWVREVWLQVDRAFFTDTDGRGHSSHDLLLLSRVLVAPHRVTDKFDRKVDFIPAFIEGRKRTRSRELSQKGVLGGFETIHAGVEPDRRWKLDIRQVAMVAADFPTPEFPANSMATCHRLVRPGRRDVVKAVATCCRYPTFLMRAEPAYVLSYLAARKGKKLSAMFGRFRNGAARVAGG